MLSQHMKAVAGGNANRQEIGRSELIFGIQDLLYLLISLVEFVLTEFYKVTGLLEAFTYLVYVHLVLLYPGYYLLQAFHSFLVFHCIPDFMGL